MPEPTDDELLRLLDRLDGFPAEMLSKARRKQEDEALAGAIPRTLLEILKDEGALDSASQKLILEAARTNDPTKVLPPAGAGLRLGPGPARPPEVVVAAKDPERRYGPFVAVSEVGRGGMGCVWKAWDDQVGRWVALKVLEGGDPDSRERFVREAQIAGRLAHPNIAAVFQTGQEKGRGWIALQFIEGAPIDAAPVPVEIALRRVRDAARALAYAHEQGVVHRDVKPGNLLVDRAGRVFLTDFGLAKESSSKKGAPLSITGAVLGTPQFMAPEQARGDRKAVGPASDVYSLGATLYALLAGRPPFPGNDVAAVLISVAERRPLPVRKFNPAVSPELQMALDRAMAKDPAARWPDCVAFADELDRLLREKRYEGRYGLARLLFRQWAPWVAAAALAGAALRFAVPALLAKPPAAVRDEAAEAFRDASVALGLAEMQGSAERPRRVESEVLPRLDRVFALRPGDPAARVLRARALAVSGRAVDASRELAGLDGVADYRVPYFRALLGLEAALAAPPPLPQIDAPAPCWDREPARPEGPWIAELRRALSAAVDPSLAEEYRRDGPSMRGLLAFAEGRWADAAHELSGLRRAPPVDAVRRVWIRAAYLSRDFAAAADADAPRERAGAALARAKSVEDLERALPFAAGDPEAADALRLALARRAVETGLDPARFEAPAGAVAAAAAEACRLRRRALSAADGEEAWRKAAEALPTSGPSWVLRLAAAEARLGLGVHRAARGGDGRGALEEAAALADGLARFSPDWAAPRVLRAAAKRRLGRLDDALAELEGLGGSAPALVEAAWIGVEQGERERKAGRSAALPFRTARRRAVEALALAPGHPEALAAGAAAALGLLQEGPEPGLLTAAAGELDRALAAAPGYGEALLARGRSELLMADSARRGGGDGRAESAAAAADLGEILKALPGHGAARHLRGVARFGAGDYDGALSDWRALIAADGSWETSELRDWMRHAEERLKR